jgi:phage terminase small subunit
VAPVSKLTDKQEMFCQEYLKDLNATQAAIRAGYAERTAQPASSRLLSNVIVQARINELKSERSERVQIDADWVLKHNAEILNADVADILNDEGAYLPIKQWPLIWRQMLNGIDIQQLLTSGKDSEVIGEVVKIKFIDRLKALEMIGKHVSVAAYTERHLHEHSMTQDQWLMEKQRERNEQRTTH